MNTNKANDVSRGCLGRLGRPFEDKNVKFAKFKKNIFKKMAMIYQLNKPNISEQLFWNMKTLSNSFWGKKKIKSWQGL
jgi:hypothetical protein